MPRLRSSHFGRKRTSLRRPAAAPVLRRPSASAYISRAASRETNREHVRRGLPLQLRPTRAGSTPRLQHVEEQSFAELSRLSLPRARAFLEKKGFFSPVTGRTCWRCGSPYRNGRLGQSHSVWSTRTNPTLRCSLRSCDGRLCNSKYSYTPLYKSLRRQSEPSLNDRQLLQVFHCYGNKVPLDSASGMVDLGTTVGVSRRELYKHAAWFDLSSVLCFPTLTPSPRRLNPEP